MQRGARRGGSIAAAVAVAAALVTGCTPSSAQPQVDRALDSQSPAAAAPVIVRDCWVPTSAGNISLTSQQARDLTNRAARLGRHSRNPDRIVARLQPAVARTVAAGPAESGEGGGDALTPQVAAEMAAGLTGVRAQSRLVCAYARTSVEPQRPGPSGLVPRARQLRAAWTEVFGPIPAGGFARGGVHSGHVDGSAHYEGRAIDVFFRPLGDREQHRRGWVFAQWLIAHAPDHNVLSVIYDDHIWTSWAAYAGWRDYVHPGATFQHRGNSVLRHREHVHVAVESGRPFTGR